MYIAFTNKLFQRNLYILQYLWADIPLDKAPLNPIESEKKKFFVTYLLTGKSNMAAEPHFEILAWCAV